MPDTDQQKWDKRYAQQVQRESPSPAPWLLEVLPELPRGVALDLACGRGGNAIYLADHGYIVDAIDISPVGLQLAQEAAHTAGVKVNFSCLDLLADVEISSWHYDLIVMYHFMAPALLARIHQALRPGGVLMVEQHMSGFPNAAGPSSNRFRVAPGALAQAARGLEVIRLEEGLFSRGDGAPFALSRLLAQRVP